MFYTYNPKKSQIIKCNYTLKAYAYSYYMYLQPREIYRCVVREFGEERFAKVGV